MVRPISVRPEMLSPAFTPVSVPWLFCRAKPGSLELVKSALPLTETVGSNTFLALLKDTAADCTAKRALMTLGLWAKAMSTQSCTESLPSKEGSSFWLWANSCKAAAASSCACLSRGEEVLSPGIAGAEADAAAKASWLHPTAAHPISKDKKKVRFFIFILYKLTAESNFSYQTRQDRLLLHPVRRAYII